MMNTVIFKGKMQCDVEFFNLSFPSFGLLEFHEPLMKFSFEILVGHCH